MAENEDNNIILLLGQLHRIIMWENFLMKDSMPNAWYAFKMAKKNKTAAADHPLGIFGVDATQEDTAVTTATPPQSSTGQQGETSSSLAASAQDNKEASPTTNQEKEKTPEEKVPDANDPRMQNIKHFKLLLGDIPQFLMPVFQGLYCFLSVMYNIHIYCKY